RRWWWWWRRWWWRRSHGARGENHRASPKGAGPRLQRVPSRLAQNPAIHPRDTIGVGRLDPAIHRSAALPHDKDHFKARYRIACGIEDPHCGAHRNFGSGLRALIVALHQPKPVRRGERDGDLGRLINLEGTIDQGDNILGPRDTRLEPTDRHTVGSRRLF